MKKMVYVAWDSKLGGNDYEVAVSFDLEECRDAAVRDREHLTDRERLGCEHYIKGYKVPVLDGQSARVAYEEWGYEQCCMPDPDYYEDVYVDSDYRVDVKMFKTNYHIWISRRSLCIMSRLLGTDSLIYVSDRQRYNEYLEEGNDDDGDIILVSDAVDADVGLVSDTLDKLGITLPSSVMAIIKEKIEAIYRAKSI